MRKYLNILSAAVLIVYGALTLVVVPLHRHHNENNISTKQLPSAVTQSSAKTAIAMSADGCDICTFSSLSVLVHPSIHSISPTQESRSIVVVTTNYSTNDFSGCLSLRGPPPTFS